MAAVNNLQILYPTKWSLEPADQVFLPGHKVARYVTLEHGNPP